ncbi:MAG: ketoacyl-ACP synthase III [Treponemataceae bacterium]|nr:ketoacyl-ACP synthase III [Treponemataceae bacterium]
MSVIIRAMGKALPKNCVTNNDLPKELDTSDEWIVSHTGIHSRYISDKEETCSSLGARACKNALEVASVDVKDVGLIICATTTSDFVGFPSTACVIQAAIGAVNATCFDVTAACSGFLYAMDTAVSLMERHKYKYALIIGSEVLSRICDWKDRSSCILFGDGAGAALLELKASGDGGLCADKVGAAGIGTFISGSDGNGGKALYVDESGLLRMDGHAIYTFAVKIMTEIIRELMEREKLKDEDVDYFVCHQANERILSAAAKRLELDFSKFVITLDEYGNTSSASIPLTLADMDKKGMLRKGTTIVSAAFGAGLTWAGTVIRF